MILIIEKDFCLNRFLYATLMYGILIEQYSCKIVPDDKALINKEILQI